MIRHNRFKYLWTVLISFGLPLVVAVWPPLKLSTDFRTLADPAGEAGRPCAGAADRRPQNPDWCARCRAAVRPPDRACSSDRRWGMHWRRCAGRRCGPANMRSDAFSRRRWPLGPDYLQPGVKKLHYLQDPICGFGGRPCQGAETVRRLEQCTRLSFLSRKTRGKAHRQQWL
jgi:hypothetical protein